MLSLQLKSFSILLLIAFLNVQPVNAEEEGTRDNPLTATISALLADPWTYDGQFVRVTGTFDDCSEYYCRICEAEKDLHRLVINWRSISYKEREEIDRLPDRCGGVAFAIDGISLPEANSVDDRLFDLIYDTFVYQIELAARFSTATIEARFVAKCVDPRIDPVDGSITVCRGSFAAFVLAEIVSFHENRPATQGVFGGVNSEKIIRPLNKETNALKRAFRKANFWRTDVDDDAIEVFAFLFPKVDFSKYGEELYADGGICICIEDSCKSSDWPRLVGHVRVDSPVNPYQCWRAFKRRGQWVFPIDF